MLLAVSWIHKLLRPHNDIERIAAQVAEKLNVLHAVEVMLEVLVHPFVWVTVASIPRQLQRTAWLAEFRVRQTVVLSPAVLAEHELSLACAMTIECG